MIIIFIMMMKMTKYEYDYNFEKKPVIISIVTNVINVAEGNSDQILQIICPILFPSLMGMCLLLNYKLSAISQIWKRYN